MTTAVAQHSRVENLAARTPTSSSYANPDGTWTMESFSGVVRSKSDEDEWVGIDPAVAKSDEGFAPAAVPFDVNFSKGGSKDLATVRGGDGGGLTVGFGQRLGKGRADGDQVVYDTDGSNGESVEVTSHADGFNFSIRLPRAPSRDAAAPVYRFPLEVAKGSSLKARRDGSFEVVEHGRVMASISAPVMWDSATEPARVPVTAELEGTGRNRVLVLRPDPAWLTAPERVYPVVVDPTVTLTTSGDTFVQSLLDTPRSPRTPSCRSGPPPAG